MNDETRRAVVEHHTVDASQGTVGFAGANAAARRWASVVLVGDTVAVIVDAIAGAVVIGAELWGAGVLKRAI